LCRQSPLIIYFFLCVCMCVCVCVAGHEYLNAAEPLVLSPALLQLLRQHLYYPNGEAHAYRVDEVYDCNGI
jgi:hypothetical protein